MFWLGWHLCAFGQRSRAGASGIAPGVTGIAGVTRPRGEWTGRRQSYLRVCCASNAALGYFRPGVKGGGTFSSRAAGAIPPWGSWCRPGVYFCGVCVLSLLSVNVQCLGRARVRTPLSSGLSPCRRLHAQGGSASRSAVNLLTW